MSKARVELKADIKERSIELYDRRTLNDVILSLKLPEGKYKIIIKLKKE